MRRSFCKRVGKVKFGLFTNGKERIADNDLFSVQNPATGKDVFEVAQATTEDVNQAISDAHEAFGRGTWSRSDVRDRSVVLFRIAANLRGNIPRLAELEVVHTGRPIKEITAQLARLPEWFEYYGSLIRTQEGSCPPFLGNYLNYVKRIPLGVCGLLTPWNHPMLIAVKKLAPALACGNSVVIKPSELAPGSVVELAKICTESGLPDGVMHVMTGLGSNTGQAICKHPLVRKVDLTGGTDTGRLVGAAAGQNLAGVVSELGGKAPLIIFSDTDLKEAVNGTAFASFIASGQTCIMGARLIVHSSIYDQFVSALVNKIESIRLGDPTDMNTQMGPVISAESLNRVSTMVNNAISQGAELLTGGCPPQPTTLPLQCRDGHYYKPTLLRVTKDMNIWREEVFGPVVVVLSFESEEEAIQLADDSPYGLAAGIWTKDIARAHRVADALQVGIVWINDHHRNDPSSPWGGMKESGIGRENGISALWEYSQTKSVIVKYDSKPFDWFQPSTTRYS